MLVSSKMAAVVTDLTSSFMAGQREIKEEAQDPLVLFVKKHKLLNLNAWNSHGHFTCHGRLETSGEQGRRRLRVDAGLASQQRLPQIFS